MFLHQHYTKLSNNFTNFIYLHLSVQKTIERYKTYTKDNVSSKTVQQDIEVTTLNKHDNYSVL
jgi:hypothetical protein